MLNAEDLARATAVVVPLLAPLMREIRARGGDRVADAIDMFANAPRRPALLSRIGLVEGAVGAGEYITMVRVANLQL